MTFNESSNITPEIFSTLGNLPDLDTLSLSGKSFAPEDLAALQAATHLQPLSARYPDE